MMRVSSILAAVLALLSGCAPASPPATAEHSEPEAADSAIKRPSPPAGARLSVETDKPAYFLGENILLNFRVENAGSQPFSLDSSDESTAAEDYTQRDKRYRVTAIAADGHRATPRGPYPDWELSYTADTAALEPGQVFYETLPLWHFVNLDRPGDYTVSVRSNLGWQWTSADRSRLPDAKTKIAIRIPTAAQAAQVVEDARRLSAQILAARKARTADDEVNDGPQAGKKTAPFPDFTAMHYPVYVPALAEAARGGVVDAVKGIALIDTPEASVALMDLLDDGNDSVFAAASGALEMRLPDNANGRHHSYSISSPTQAEVQSEIDWWQHMVRAAWRPAFTARLRDWSKRQIKALAANAPDPGRWWFATELMQDLGTNQDFAFVMSELDAELTRANDPLARAEALGGSNGGLINAAVSLHRFRGARLPADPQHAAEIVVYLHEVDDRRAERLANWDKRLAGWLRHENPYVRAYAAGCLPRDPSPPLQALLPALAFDPNPIVQVYFLSWVRGDHVTAARPLVEQMRGRPLDPRVRQDIDGTLDAIHRVK